MFHTQLMCSTGAVQVGVERQEELPSGQVPQLAARTQRGTNHVRHAQDWPHGAIHERSRGTRHNQLQKNRWSLKINKHLKLNLK